MFIIGFISGGLVGICYMVLMKISTIMDLQQELDNERVNNIKLENLILQLRDEIHGIENEDELEEDLTEYEVINLEEYLEKEGIR